MFCGKSMFARLLLFALLLTGGSVAGAQVIVSNYPPANDTSNSVDLDNTRAKALRFTTGAAAQNVGTLTLRLGRLDTAGEAIVELYDDGAGVPGTNALVSFTPVALGGLEIA